MNKARRKTISAIKARLEELAALAAAIREEIEAVRDEEQEYKDAMPESLQGGDKGEKADEAVTALDEAITILEQIESEAQEASEHLVTAAA